jgi:hypothetical protein
MALTPEALRIATELVVGTARDRRNGSELPVSILLPAGRARLVALRIGAVQGVGVL